MSNQSDITEDRFISLEDNVKSMDGRMTSMESSLQTILTSLQNMEARSNKEETQTNILKKGLENTSTQFSAVQKEEAAIEGRILEDERKQASLISEVGKIESYLNSEQDALHNFIQDKITTELAKFKNGKVSSKEEILMKVNRYFPEIITNPNSPLLAGCTKSYGEVSLVAPTEIHLKTENYREPAENLLKIQSLLKGKHVSFDSWGPALHNFCGTGVTDHLYNDRKEPVDWITAIYHFFKNYEFSSKTRKDIVKLQKFQPTPGSNARSYLLDLIELAKAVRGASTLTMTITKVADILDSEFPALPIPDIAEMRKFDELIAFVQLYVRDGVTFPNKTSSTPFFAINRAYPSKSKPKQKVSAANYYCVNCRCSKCSGNLKPYMKSGFCINCHCAKCTPRVKRFSKQDITNIKVNMLEAETEVFPSDIDDDEFGTEFAAVLADESYEFSSLESINDSIGESEEPEGTTATLQEIQARP
ncbi:Tkp3 protein [Vanderwaltozyma polyspora DSM 70294]|uniref:Tkp3 protein n=1 Tax=Vanderwaltozyma polyspora (strain ATCC 22028 / DSM 70294 / BCRC 21397 / CBS 2163 / NBRC 10782 / NRRL Y-8283 / UCD 57-17) TaxID=436907 RepID=A7TKH0_VANPO|nr:Tkp3 protein [Vanderwaltozyma polyspora DSM 70294]EDO17192.1 Tkp3 protein [Vanderwaltozyma polyspora DSM 70294]